MDKPKALASVFNPFYFQMVFFSRLKLAVTTSAPVATAIRRRNIYLDSPKLFMWVFPSQVFRFTSHTVVAVRCTLSFIIVKSTGAEAELPGNPNSEK